MALVLADRVKESTTTTGTGTVTLLGAAPGFQSFAVVGNANTTYYTIAGQTSNEWEVGIGTYTASGTLLARTTVLSNSAGTQPSALSFSAGTKDVFVTYPAEKSINQDASGNVGIGTTSPTSTLSVTGTANVTGNVTLGDATTDTVTVNGYMAIGGAVSSAAAMYVRNSALAGTNQYGVRIGVTGSQAGTASVRGTYTALSTEAAAYTATLVAGHQVDDVTKGAGSTITSQYGLYIANQTQGTNNYGIASFVSSGTDKWNIYASGTAQNYFAGNVGIGTTVPAYPLDVTGIIRRYQSSASALPVEGVRLEMAGNNAAARGLFMSFYGPGGSGTSREVARINGLVNSGTDTGGFLSFETVTGATGTNTERMRIDSSGNLLIGTTTSPAGSKELVLGGDYIEGVVAIGTVTTTNTIALTNGTVQTATLTASTACTFTMPSNVAGKSFVLLLKQAAATGNGTATFTSVKWGSSGAPTITATAGKMDILTFIADGTNWYGSAAQGYTP
jgi:hypothetical protein